MKESEENEETSEEEFDSEDENEKDALVDLIINDSSLDEVCEYIERESLNDFNYPVNGWTPLHYATVKNKKDICELLVQKGSDIKYKALNTPAIFSNYNK